MSKFEMKLELTGLKLEIKGDKADVSLLSRSVQQQLAGMIGSAAATAGTGAPDRVIDTTADVSTNLAVAPGGAPRKAQRGRAASAGKSAATEGNIIKYEHKPELYGNARSTWLGQDKIIWMMYVLREAGFAKVAAKQVIATFNHNFKEAVTLDPKNATRDLRRLKQGGKDRPGLVGEDATESPSRFFLIDLGIKAGGDLCAAARGEAATGMFGSKA